MTLHPYQKEGSAFLASRRRALLADEPRLGKTYQVIDALDRICALKVLVVCPAGVVENWKRKIVELRQGDWSARVVSYEFATGSGSAELVRQRWCVIVVDEAHYIKNLSAKRTIALYGDGARMEQPAIAACADYVWLLTGTPMPRHAGELYSHLRALAPDLIRSERTGELWSEFQFQHAYCVVKNTGFGMKVVGSRNEAKLNRKLADFMLRRRKKDVWSDVPPTLVTDLWVEADVSGLPGDEMEIARKAMAEHGIDGLRRVAANGSVSTLRRLTGMAKVPGVAAWAKDFLESTPATSKVVLFAHHQEVISALHEHLKTDFLHIRNDTKDGERQRILDRFQTDPSVRGLICRMMAEGVGVQMSAADDLVIIEPSWVPAVNEQVADRIVDIGKTRKNTVHLAKIGGSLDEDIVNVLTQRIRSIEMVVDGVS